MKLKNRKFCQKCGNINWTFVSSNSPPIGNTIPMQPYGEGMQTTIVECEDCDFIGVFPSVKIDKIKNIQKKFKNKKGETK